jgi:2-polyprenyl-6-hydroxyphenyl methylase/3-demethylubiquinone-9 3-methyltransferase
MIKNVKFGGYLIIANCFYPVIKCHLPQNFHFRYSFNFFAKLMGLKKIGLLQGSHATLFKKVDKQIDWRYLRFFEKLSKFLFPIIESLKNSLRPIKYLIIR